MKPSCSGCSLPFCSSPSTVMRLLPFACTANIVHDFTGRPSSSTVHAPQCVVSHPMCVPVSRRTSRIRWTSRSRGSTSASCVSPLIESWTRISLPPSVGALGRLAERARRQDSHQVFLVLDGAAQILRRLRRRGGEPRGLGDRGVVQPLAAQGGLRLLRLDRREPDVGQPDTGLLARAI